MRIEYTGIYKHDMNGKLKLEENRQEEIKYCCDAMKNDDGYIEISRVKESVLYEK